MTSPQEWYEKGRGHFDKKEWDDAMVCYKRAIELEPSYADAYINLGLCYRYQLKYDNAREEYKKALDVNPRYTLAWNNIGYTYELENKA